MTHEKDMSFVRGGNCELSAICHNRTIFHYKVPFLMEMKVIFLITPWVPPQDFFLRSSPLTKMSIYQSWGSFSEKTKYCFTSNRSALIRLLLTSRFTSPIYAHHNMSNRLWHLEFPIACQTSQLDRIYTLRQQNVFKIFNVAAPQSCPVSVRFPPSN